MVSKGGSRSLGGRPRARAAPPQGAGVSLLYKPTSGVGAQLGRVRSDQPAQRYIAVT